MTEAEFEARAARHAGEFEQLDTKDPAVQAIAKAAHIEAVRDGLATAASYEELWGEPFPQQ